MPQQQWSKKRERQYDQITQIYEGTNQVQRIVMARQLLAGVQSRL